VMTTMAEILARLRLQQEAFDELLVADPNTALTRCGLRRLVNDGTIPHVRIGRKKLINFDALMAYLTMAD